jgi:HipA-like C-terminal domain
MITQASYPVYNVNDTSSSSAVEYLGSKPKEWRTYEVAGKEMQVLLKQGRVGTGENWAEKVTCELADLLNLPHAIYDLAKLNDIQCVISRNFLEEGDSLVLGNELIEGFDKEQKFHNTSHTLNAILEALEKNKTQLPWNMLGRDLVIMTVVDLLVGYLCFDALIGNTDRHAENWGVIKKSDGKIVLAPTFDHASSLGRNERDKKILERLRSKDNGFNVKGYVNGAKTPIYDNDGKLLNTVELVKECKKYAPKATEYWIGVILHAVRRDEVRCIFDRIDEQFITEPAKEFAMAILVENMKRLREILV